MPSKKKEMLDSEQVSTEFVSTSRRRRTGTSTRGPGRPAQSVSSSTHPLFIARSRLRLTQRDVQARLGVSGTNTETISAWEHGRHIPRAVQAASLARILEFPSGDALIAACRQWQQEHLDEFSTNFPDS